MVPAPEILDQGPEEAVEETGLEAEEVRVTEMAVRDILLPTPSLPDALASSKVKTREVCVATWLFRQWEVQSSASGGI